MKRISMKGRKFGRLTAIESVGSKGTTTMWLCSCECGSEKIVNGSSLGSGGSKSCGCLRRELDKAQTTHGLSKTRLYSTWSDMRKRCTIPKNVAYKYYGGRGISVCKEWDDFVVFYEWAIGNGYEDELTIDRIDSDGDYSPENCRWETRAFQSRNKRNNKYITVDGETYLEIEYAEKNGINAGTFRTRVGRGWDVKTAATKPLRVQGRRP